MLLLQNPGGCLPGRTLAFSPDGRYLASVTGRPEGTLWDVRTWRPARSFDWQIGDVMAAAFSPDGFRVAAGSESGKVVIWDVDE